MSLTQDNLISRLSSPTCSFICVQVRHSHMTMASQAGLGWAILTPLGWRWLLAVSSIPLFFLAALYPVIPESPYWLVAAGRATDAQEALARVARVNKRDLPARSLKVQALPAVSGASYAYGKFRVPVGRCCPMLLFGRSMCHEHSQNQADASAAYLWQDDP